MAKDDHIILTSKEDYLKLKKILNSKPKKDTLYHD